MGNKDARSREKKPKKQEPKLMPMRRGGDQITTKTTPAKPKNPTPTP
jgi:hypothetical protein